LDNKGNLMTKNIQRRVFLLGAAAVGAAGAAGTALAASFPKPAIASGARQWRMVLAWQKLLPGLGTSAVRLAERITSLSGGQLEVTVYDADELGKGNVFDAVAKGTFEMGHSAPYYWLNKNKALSFFCSVPGGLTMQEQNGWLYFGGGKGLWDEFYAEFGLIAFPAGNTGCQTGGWFNREINSIKDFKDLKIRMPGLGGEVFAKFGAVIKEIPAQELFTAMQNGVVDALDWVGAWNDMSLGLHRVSKYYYGNAFAEGGSTLELMVNKKAFDGLPKELQQIVKVACSAENDILTAEFNANNIRAFHSLKYEHKVDIRSYPDSVSKALYKASEEVVANVANEGEIEKRIYYSYEQYRKYTLEMSPYSEMGFMQRR
jgi:TRAP-type mannitol/chloroaromatic compound transport system substrate-binding protein